LARCLLCLTGLVAAQDADNGEKPTALHFDDPSTRVPEQYCVRIEIH